MDDRSIFTRGTLLLGVIFFLGMVCGAALFYLGQKSVPGGGDTQAPRWAGGRMHPEEQLARELDLDPDQRQQVAEILLRSREGLRTMLEQSRVEIRELLTPEQQETFDKLRPHRRRGPGRFPRAGRPGAGEPGPRRPPPPPSEGAD